MTFAALVIEWFVAANLTFLVGDILLAHSMNAFRHWAEWVPFGFSLVAGPALMVGLWRGRARTLGYVVAWSAILIGVAGFLLHLESQFFQGVSMRSLVYTAPLAAPLAYAGLGMLLLLNRMVTTTSEEWLRWALLLTTGGWAGNLALALMDHAQNGFYYWSEWLPVIASAFTLAFLVLLSAHPHDRQLRTGTGLCLALSALIGIAGFLLHLRADLLHPASNRLDAILYGAPPFAPLLLVDLAVLGGIVILGGKAVGR